MVIAKREVSIEGTVQENTHTDLFLKATIKIN